ncbi:MAG: GTPase Era [Bacteroidaceae bacterium]|jgi:GTP-binding protein Era|nr:GTPase Era [Muribaculaceae bacterium]MBR5511947.1 GTPase Era [Bacteroidaceae bacterium]MBQ1185687.1 GTPase Era [Muribaculaceae bacterium]MBQ2371052.1 GTPase Era [Muribaculaceae bacterium]MBQ2399527.1 GTPase Era [Muribaculaceae bacterium]
METIDNIADSISFAEQGRSAEEVNEVINAKLDIVDEHHKAGFVNIVGNPNVGKSTLMNDLVGERISIITSKAQTTRHRIMGIVNTPDYQIVYSDTPGVLKPKYKLQESMLDFSQGALTDADVLLYVTDVVEDPTKNLDFLNRVAKEKVPVILIINKIDLLKGNADLIQIIDRWKEILPKAEVFPTSAKEHFNVDNLKKRILELLPVSPPFFGKDALTDKPARFFVTEIIREKILLNYDKEIPYSAEVLVEKFDEKEETIHIMAVIYVERDTQKGIIIGRRGEKIKQVGTEARKEIERFFDKRVFLEIFVKVEDDWRNRENKLRAFGYIE